MIEQKTINELEMSISFGQRLMEYKKECLHKMLEQMDSGDKILQHYKADKLYIQDIITALECGENMYNLSSIKSRLTIVCQMFFKKEFKTLKELLQ
jgi:hypothetical protein